MQMNDYHRRADATLAYWLHALEPAFESGALEELELSDGALTIETDLGKIFVLSKHNVTQQIWLASPVSGGLHFQWHDTDGTWNLSDGRW